MCRCLSLLPMTLQAWPPHRQARQSSLLRHGPLSAGPDDVDLSRCAWRCLGVFRCDDEAARMPQACLLSSRFAAGAPSLPLAIALDMVSLREEGGVGDTRRSTGGASQGEAHAPSSSAGVASQVHGESKGEVLLTNA